MQVQPLTGGVGAEQHANLAGRQLARDIRLGHSPPALPIPDLAAVAAIAGEAAAVVRLEAVAEVGHRIGVFGEDEHRVIIAEQITQDRVEAIPLAIVIARFRKPVEESIDIRQASDRA